MGLRLRSARYWARISHDNDCNIWTINLPLAAGSTIEVDRLPVLINHPGHFLHIPGAGWQLSDLNQDDAIIFAAVRINLTKYLTNSLSVGTVPGRSVSRYLYLMVLWTWPKLYHVTRLGRMVTLSLSWSPNFIIAKNMTEIFWPDLERREKSLKWISSHNEALGFFQERLFSSSQQRWKVLSWHNMNGRLPVDRDIVHLEEVGGPGARPDLNQTSRILLWHVNFCHGISPCNFHSTLCGASRQI